MEDVKVSVAIERMWIFARLLSFNAKTDLEAAVMAGKPATYPACDHRGRLIGHTTITPQDNPVTLVTETGG